MGWNTGFSLVTDLSKGCSLPMVLKHNAWRGVCNVVKLNIDILIGTSVWGLEGVKNSIQKPHLTGNITQCSQLGLVWGMGH